MSQSEVWLAGWLSGDLPETELEAFQDWLRRDPLHRRSFLTAVALDQQLRTAYRPPGIPRFGSWRLLGIMTSVAALVLIGVGLLWNAALAPPPPARVVSGWALSEGLLLDDAFPGNGTRITTSQGGELKRAGSLVQVQPGTEILLGRAGDDVSLTTGRLIVTLENEPPTKAPGPQAFRTIRIETPCGKIVLDPGTKLELTSESLLAPGGGPIQQVDVFVLAGAILPPVLRPMPMVPPPVEAHTGIRLTRMGDGPVTMTRLPAP